MKEDVIEDILMERFEGVGVYVRKNKHPVPVGEPDLTLRYRGRIMYVEVKTLTGRLSGNQKDYIHLARENKTACRVLSLKEDSIYCMENREKVSVFDVIKPLTMDFE